MVYFQTNSQVLVLFGSPFDGNFGIFTTIWYTLWPFVLFYGNLVYVVAILVYCIKKNLATLAMTADVSVLRNWRQRSKTDNFPTFITLATGVRDLDCPSSGLCCFNGCVNICEGPSEPRIPIPPPPPPPP
jgi:hypothetical protein